MTDRLAHVDAVFGGESLRFELLREDLHSFEVVANTPAFALLARFTRGIWTIKDLYTVLRFAHPNGYTGSVDGVALVLQERAPMPYVLLATRVLEAALFGIDKADAVFDETLIERVELA